jgi:hypothetical protein
MSVWRDWEAKRRARRARLEQNRDFLRRVADEIGAEFETKSYEELRDRGAEEFSSERIVDGITTTYSGEAYETLKNGDLTFCVDLDGLPAPWGIKSSYHFYKRPDGSVYY